MEEENSSSTPIETGTLSLTPKRKRHFNSLWIYYPEIVRAGSEAFLWRKRNGCWKLKSTISSWAWSPTWPIFILYRNCKWEIRYLEGWLMKCPDQDFSQSITVCHHKMSVMIMLEHHISSACLIKMHHSIQEMFIVNSKIRLATRLFCSN